MTDQPRVFFSYSRNDSDFVVNLAKRLRDAGANIWLDQLDIGAGTIWDQEVEQALKSCSTLIAVLSPSSVSSRNVMDEISYALENGKEVIPILCEECDVPFRLARVQYLDFRNNADEAFARLAADLAAPPSEPAVATPPVERMAVEEPPPAPRVAPAAGRQGPATWLAAAAAVVALAIAGYFFMQSRASSEDTEPAEVTVPRVVGMTLEEAEAMLATKGLAIGETTTQPSQEPPGTILDMVPAAGDAALEGTSVELVVSDARVLVPDVVGEVSDEARVQVAEAGLQSVVELALDPELDSSSWGKVLATEPAADEPVPRETEVKLFVSGRGGWIYLGRGARSLEKDQEYTMPSALNLRDGNASGSASKTLGVVKAGEVVTLMSDVDGQGWVQVLVRE